MADWLLLRLPAEDDAPISWVVADGQGQLLSLPSQDDSGGLHTMATGRRVALLVPAGEVSFFQATLPAGNETRLLQLAPFALEDQVSQDLDALHFAVGTRDATSGAVPVAVMERSRLEYYLARASRLQLIPHAVFAESDLAPVLPGHVTMLVSDDQLLLRDDTARPLVLPAADPLLALEMLPGAGANLAQSHLTVFVGPGDWQAHAAVLEPLRERVASFKVQLSNGGVLAQLAQGLVHGAPLNLLQGALKPRSTAKGNWQAWRWVAGLAGVLLVLHLAGSLWQLRHLRRTSIELDGAIAQLYGSIFPGQPIGREPRLTLEKRLAAVASGGGSQGEFMSLLAAVAAARQNVPVAQLESLTFKPGGLQLKLTAPDASALDQFNQALRAGGYKAELKSGSAKGTAYEGLVEMSGAGS
jgi:general secretion pathway protein L